MDATLPDKKRPQFITQALLDKAYPSFDIPNLKILKEKINALLKNSKQKDYNRLSFKEFAKLVDANPKKYAKYFIGEEILLVNCVSIIATLSKHVFLR